MNSNTNFKKMVLIAFLSTIVLASCVADEQKHEKIVSEIMFARDFDSLTRPIKRLDQAGDDAMILAVIHQLLSRIDSLEPLEFRPDFESSNRFPFREKNGKMVGFPGPVNPGDKRKKYDHYWIYNMTIQPLCFEGGRCVWALESILALYLPPFDENANEAERNDYHSKVEKLVTRELKRTPNSTRISQLNIKERVALARSKQLNPKAALRLAKDESPVVREAVAKSKWLPNGYRIHVLRNDDNESVRAATFGVRDAEWGAALLGAYRGKLRER